MQTLKVLASLSLVFIYSVFFTLMVYWIDPSFEITPFPLMLCFLLGFITYPITQWLRKVGKDTK